MKIKNLCLLIGLILLLGSCADDVQPKPKSFLALEYPPHRYNSVKVDCPYKFEINKIAEVEPSKNGKHCWFDIDYPAMDGTIFLSYKPVNDNLKKLLKDAQNLPLKHTIKADAIEGDAYTNPSQNTYGTFYKVTGDAASQAQFYLTDSTDHFISGSVYFRKVPNYDSILPAAHYIEQDIKHLMESVQWEDKE